MSVEGGVTGGAVTRTVLLAVATASIVVGSWAASRPMPLASPGAPVRSLPEPVEPVPAVADEATSVLNVRPVEGTPYTVLFSGVGQEEADASPSLFTAPRVVGVHNVVLLNTDTGASRSLLPDDARLVLNARLLSPAPAPAYDPDQVAAKPKPAEPPRWIALSVADAEGQPVDLLVAPLDGGVPAVALTGLTRVVRVWSRDRDTIAALVRVGDALTYRTIDAATLNVTGTAVVPLGG